MIPDCSRVLAPKSFSNRLGTRLLPLCGALLYVAAPAAPAATVYWDPGQTAGATGSDGSGTWDNTTANFSTGTADQAYASTQIVQTTVTTASGGNTITVSTAQAALLTVGDAFNSAAFPTGTVINSIDTTTGIVTLSASSTTALNSGSTLIFAPNVDVRFGAAATGTGGTVTIGTGVTQSANNLTLSPQAAGTGYTFNGGTISLGMNNGATGTLTVGNSTTINSALQLNQLAFNVTGQTLTLTGGSVRFTTGGGNGGISGSTGAIAAASTLTFSAPTGGTATYNTQANDLYNIGNPNLGGTASAGLVVANGATFQTANTTGAVAANNIFIGYGANGVATVQSGGTWSQNSPSSGLGALVLGRGNIGRFIVQSGGTLLNTGTAINVGITIGMGGTGELDVQGGTVTTNFIGINAGASSAGNTGLLNITGGTTNVGTINFGTGYAAASTTGTGTVTLGGGSLYVGAGGVVISATGTYTTAFNLSGGTLGANAAWTSSVPMTLTAATTSTIQTANATGTANNIGLSGTLSGTGTLTKTGAGMLTLSGPNTYSGGTNINGGTLLTGSTSALGSGAGTVAIGNGGTLNVAGTGTVGSLTLGTGAALTLANGGTLAMTIVSGSSFDTITSSGALTLNGTLALDGTPNSATTYQLFSGFTSLTDPSLTITGAPAGYTGTLSSTGLLSFTPVPEPSTWVAGLLCVGVLGMSLRRRSLKG